MVAIVLVIISLCASLSEAAFVPASSAATSARRCFTSEPSRRIGITQFSLASSKDGRGSDRKNSKTYTTRIPRHQEEAVGITGGLGLWGEIRRRTSRERRQQLKEKLNSLRLRRSGRRRRKLALRFKKYMLRNKSSSSSETSEDEEEDEEATNSKEAEDEKGEMIETSLDAMRARAGVLRTRVRLRQESLSDLEKLTSDVKLEMNRMEWKDAFEKRSVFMYGQTSAEEESNGNDTNDVMNESQLATINQKWKQQIKGNNQESKKAQENDENDKEEPENIMEELEDPENIMEELQVDSMKQRSLKLQNSILLDRIRLQRLERRMLCFECDELGIVERAVGNTLDSLNDFEFLESNPIMVVQRQAKKFVNTFGESSSVLLRKLDRVSSQSGPNNRDYASVTDFVVQETAAGVRIVGSLLSNPSQLSQLVDPDTPYLVAHVPAILGRLDRLESHVAPILSLVLNNKQHLRSIEPYLDEILERFDDIEPHLPWILDHIDTLAPYTGLLLKHIDELLLYAKVDEYEAGDDNYAFAEQLLPYLEVYVSQLDLVGPHLPLLRPHLPLLLKHNRIKILSPHVGKLFAKGYTDLSASANMDILLFYFGWALRVPLVPRFFFALAPPSVVSFLANRLPKRLVRGECCDVSCYVDGDYGEGWNELSK